MKRSKFVNLHDKRTVSMGFLAIHAVGLIGGDNERGTFRQVIFREQGSDTQCEMLVYRKERPLLWADLEKFERGGQVAPYRGEIKRFRFIDLVVFEGETPKDAYEKQKWKLKIRGTISFDEAEARRLETTGYMTDLTCEGAMEIGWKPVDPKARNIRYRFYSGKGVFDWTGWYEIGANTPENQKIKKA